MTTFFIGQIKEVQPENRTVKDTGVVTSYSKVTVLFEAKNAENYDVIATQDIQLPMNEIGVLQNAKGKFIAVPYATITSKNGTYTFPDDKIKYSLFDKNPLEQKKIS
jgi:hypothetical protein